MVCRLTSGVRFVDNDWALKFLWDKRPEKMIDLFRRFWVCRRRSVGRNALAALVKSSPSPVPYDCSLTSFSNAVVVELLFESQRRVDLLQIWVDAFGVDCIFCEGKSLVEIAVYSLLNNQSCCMAYVTFPPIRFLKHCIELRPRSDFVCMIFFVEKACRCLWECLKMVVSFTPVDERYFHMFPSTSILNPIVGSILGVLSPWSPSAHRLYPQDFRENVFGFLLLAKRLNLYRDVRMLIVRSMAQLYLDCALNDWAKEETWLKSKEKEIRQTFLITGGKKTRVRKEEAQRYVEEGMK
jgi:hypothetical protein